MKRDVCAPQTREWLRKAEEEETMLALELLCLMGVPAPELEEMDLCIRHMRNLLRAYRLRVMHPEWTTPFEEEGI